MFTVPPEAFGIARVFTGADVGFNSHLEQFAQTTMVTSSIMEEELRQMGIRGCKCGKKAWIR